MLIALDLLHPDPNNIRSTPATAAENAALVNSIKALGVLEPISVRPREDDDEQYWIVFGHRRVEAARAAGLAEIHADLFEGDVTAAQAAENMVRAAMHPVDQWEAVKRLMAGGWSLETAAMALGLTDRQARKIALLGKMHPGLIAAMRERGVPDEDDLRIIANAGITRQEDGLAAAVREQGKGREFDWSTVCRLCQARAIPRARAIFDIETSGVLFQQDLFCEPGDEDEWTTTDLPGFMAAQLAAVKAMVADRPDRRVFGEYRDRNYGPEIPAGYSRTWGDIPKRFKKDDPRKVVICIDEGHDYGALLEVLITPIPAKVAPVAMADAPEPEAPVERDPITKAGQQMIAGIKTAALRERLATMQPDDLAPHRVLQLLLVALSAQNVTALGTPGASYSKTSFDDLAVALTTPHGTLDLSLSPAEIGIQGLAALARILIVGGPASSNQSGVAAEWIGAAVNAGKLLPRFDTEEFLATCSGALIRELMAEGGITNGEKVGANRKALIGKLPDWRPSDFGAPGPDAPEPHDADLDEPEAPEFAEVEPAPVAQVEQVDYEAPVPQEAASGAGYAPGPAIIPALHVQYACRPFAGTTCRYLTMSATGATCEKWTALNVIMDQAVADGTTQATGDNCPGTWMDDNQGVAA